MKIPKIIYTTWISDKPFPKRFNKYIESWKKFLPDYEIRMITLENTPRNAFIDNFIENKKYAVAAQYARCQRVFETGGIYFDIDIEVIKSFDSLLNFEMFAGIESDEVDHYVNNAIFGAAKGHPFMEECMVYMNTVDTNSKDIEVGTGPLMFTKLMKKRGWIPSNKTIYYSHSLWNYGIVESKTFDNIQIFNSKYFYPYFYTEQFKPGCITKDTYAIHHWAATWKNSVSIIITCFKESEFLREAIESALNQTVKPIEVVVVNDGDKENIVAIRNIVEKYRVKLIEIIEKETEGLSSARNVGIDFAKGRWILNLDSGDKIMSTFIEKTIDKDDIVGTGLQEFGDSNTLRQHDMNHPAFADFKKRNHINYCSLFKKEIWEKIKGYDEAMKDGYTDWDFWTRATKEGFTVTVVNEPLFLYRKDGETMINSARFKTPGKLFRASR